MSSVLAVYTPPGPGVDVAPIMYVAFPPIDYSVVPVGLAYLQVESVPASPVLPSTHRIAGLLTQARVEPIPDTSLAGSGAATAAVQGALNAP